MSLEELIVTTFGFWSRQRPEQQLTNVAGTNLGPEDLRLGSFQRIAGTEFLYAELGSSSKHIASGPRGALGSARNLLFFNVNTKKAHWLLPDNGQTIESFSFLTDPPEARYAYWNYETQKRDETTIALLLELQPDAPSSEEASRTLAIAPPDGRSVTLIAASTEGLLGHHQPNKESVLVFYVSEGAARVLDVDTDTREVRSDSVFEEEY